MGKFGKIDNSRQFLFMMRATAGACIALASTAAFAQDGTPASSTRSARTTPNTSQPLGDSDIVVTANKRSSQVVTDVPVAIQAIGGNTLKAAGAASFIDIATKIPGLQLQDLGPGDKKYVIRGVNSTGESTVGVYYDEAVISGGNANDGGGRQADIRLFDLDRVEVLRGPQGTLYGANSMSGTVRYITKKPRLDAVEGYVAGEISTTHKGGTNFDVNGAINLPIVNDRIALRVVGWITDDSGYIDQVRIPAGRIKDVNNDNTKGIRGTLRFQVTDDFDIVASITRQTTSSNGSSRYTPPGTSSFSGPGYPSVPGGDLINTDLTRSPWNEQLTVYSLTGEYKLPFGTITATTNQFNRNIDFSFDSSPINFFYGAVPYPGVTLEPQSRKLNSSEIRFASDLSGPFNFVIGAYRQEDNSHLTVAVVRTNSLGFANGPLVLDNSDDAVAFPGVGNSIFGRQDDRSSTSYAAFGEATLKVTPKLEAVFGMRYFTQTLDGAQVTTHPFGGFSASPVGVLTNHDTFRKPTFKFNVSYKATPDLLFYATASEGFRGGGLNAANLPFASGIPNGFAPDKLWNYEVGAKGKLFDGAVTFDVDAYLIDWTNIQVGSIDSTGAFPYVTNAGGARIKGVEGQLEIRPALGLTVGLSGSYQDAVLTDDQPFVPGNPNRGIKGDRLPSVPHFQGNLDGAYRVPLGDTTSLTFGGNVAYRGSASTQFNNGSPYNTPLASYVLVNARVAVTSGDWTATLFVRNLTDKRAEIDAISSVQDPLARITVRPRTVGLSLNRNF